MGCDGVCDVVPPPIDHGQCDNCGGVELWPNHVTPHICHLKGCDNVAVVTKGEAVLLIVVVVRVGVGGGGGGEGRGELSGDGLMPRIFL